MSNDSEFERFYAEEYEMQHFGFSSREFITQFACTVNETIESVEKDVEESLAGHLKLDDVEKAQLHSEMNILIKLYLSRSKELINKFQSDGQNFFAIPKNVLLENDAIHNIAESKSMAKVLEEISTLEKQYMKEKTLLALYKEEIEYVNQFKTCDEHLDKVLQQIGKLSEYRSNDKRKLNKRYEKIRECLKTLVNNEQRYSNCDNECFKEKFGTNSHLRPLNIDDNTEVNKISEL